MLRIKNWCRFQHFKDRRPPWIKLYRDLLDDPEWFKLDGDSARFLVNLWLLASEDKKQSGHLPDIATISFRLRLDINLIPSLLSAVNHWLESDDINVISTRHQVGSPETETETETKTTLSQKAIRKTEAIGIIEYLNKATGKNFRPNGASLEMVEARLKDGATAEQLREVIFNKVEEWSSDPKMVKFLRPATLFNRTKFEQYLGDLHGVS